MSEDLEYEAAVSGGSLTYPVSGGSIRKNGYMIIKEFPCKITEISISKTGKHGHAKAHVFGNDIFTGKKYEDVFPTSHNVDAPVVNKAEVEVVSIEDGFINYMDDEGEIYEIELPEDEEIANGIQEAMDNGRDVTISILKSMGKEQVITFRETKN